MIRVRVLCLLSAVLLTAAHAQAQCRVEGTAKAVDGSPLAGATITIQVPGAKVPLTAVADDQGRYAFDNVKAGSRVRVIASREGRVIVEAVALITQWVEAVNLEERSGAGGFGSGDVTAGGGPKAGLSGVVRDTRGRPVAGATVVIEESLLATTTDSDGRFAFGALRPGVNVTVRATGRNNATGTAATAVPTTGTDVTDVTLDEEVVPDPDAPTSLPETVSAMYGRAAAVVAPTPAPSRPALDDQDALALLPFTPGVSPMARLAGAMSVRGGAPGEAPVTFDGITLYHIDQTSRVFGALASPAVESTTVATVPPIDRASVGALAGTIDATAAPVLPVKATGSVGASLLGGQASVVVPFGTKGSVRLAGRQSAPGELYGDAIERYGIGGNTPVRDRLVQIPGVENQTDPASSFRDISGRLEWFPTNRHTVSATVFDGQERLNRSHDMAIPLSTGLAVVPEVILAADATLQVGDYTASESRGFAGTWDARWTDRVSTTVSAARSTYTGNLARRTVAISPSTGADYGYSAGLGGTGAWADENHVADTSVRMTTTIAAGFGHRFSLGGEVRKVDVDYRAVREAFRYTAATGKYTAEYPTLLNRSQSGRLMTAWLEDRWRPWSRVIVSPGVRITDSDLTDETYVEPRIDVSIQVARPVRFRAGASVDHQWMTRVEREDLGGDPRGFWTLADGGSVRAPRAYNLTAGMRAEGPLVSFDVDGYYRSLDDLTTFAPRLFPGVAALPTNQLFHTGSGTARGVEFVLQNRSPRHSLALRYAAGRVEYDYPSLETETFPAAFDTKQAGSATGSVVIGRGLSASAAWVIGSGRPYTPVSAIDWVWLSSGASVRRVVFGAKNSGRLDPEHRLDLGLEQTVRFGRVRATAGVAVLNVYDRQSAWHSEYYAVGSTLAAEDLMLMGRTFNVYFGLGF